MPEPTLEREEQSFGQIITFPGKSQLFHMETISKLKMPIS